MREIRFKIWDKTRNKMLTSNCGAFLLTQEGNAVFHQNGNNPLEALIEQIDYEVLMYTGLKDKNGTEIYEGDIVTYSVKGFKKINKTVMTFNEEHGAYLFGIYEGVKMPCGKKTRMNKYTRKSVNNVEVIGNIYENPELLKEGE
ncbi:MAG: YopX family protein [Clostridium sp.]|uniref:YopX family protein n=1 Tax=Clostridium sp. TaxID=1506 RepID=UPI002912FAB6|nr:YopX family protein [Clostridium sp.]MDU4319773.1 YopX family protein [Clostridium sp.]